MDASHKTFGKMVSHETAPTPEFCVPESFCGPLENRHRPSLVSVGMCQGGGGTSAQAWGTCPHGSCHTGTGAGGMGGSLDWVKAEEEFFQKKGNVLQKKNVSCSGTAE